MRFPNRQMLGLFLCASEKSWVMTADRARSSPRNLLKFASDEPVGGERRPGPRLRETADGADRAYQDRGVLAGLNLGEGASGWNRGAKKHGPQAIGKSRGGWNTKVHLVAADARTAITFALSPGNAHDAP